MLFVLLAANHAIADTNVAERRAELQIGGPLRIVIAVKESMTPTVIGAVRAAVLIGSSLGVSSTLGQASIGYELHRDSDPHMSYAVTSSLSIAVGYHYVEAEDRVADLAIATVQDVDYQSHDLLVRAHWHFQQSSSGR